ncbi:reverse transcriptase domain-containing protein [bacterium]|nr:reverse transcriptase domain-containing protein [bacterium]
MIGISPPDIEITSPEVEISAPLQPSVIAPSVVLGARNLGESAPSQGTNLAASRTNLANLADSPGLLAGLKAGRYPAISPDLVPARGLGANAHASPMLVDARESNTARTFSRTATAAESARASTSPQPQPSPPLLSMPQSRTVAAPAEPPSALLSARRRGGRRGRPSRALGHQAAATESGRSQPRASHAALPSLAVTRAGAEPKGRSALGSVGLVSESKPDLRVTAARDAPARPVGETYSGQWLPPGADSLDFVHSPPSASHSALAGEKGAAANTPPSPVALAPADSKLGAAANAPPSPVAKKQSRADPKCPGHHALPVEATKSVVSAPLAPDAKLLASLSFLVRIDSGCTGSLTSDRSRLINVRPCGERFRAADKVMATAECIGDMPVVFLLGGQPVFVNFTNVRFVPQFDYTLLSVRQMWREQRIDARFSDHDSLYLPASAGGHRLRFIENCELPSLRALSVPILMGSALRKPSAGSLETKSKALVGESSPANKSPRAAPESRPTAPSPSLLPTPPTSPPVTSPVAPSSPVPPSRVPPKTTTASEAVHEFVESPSIAPQSIDPEPSPLAGRSSIALGFHAVRSSSHIARLPAPQAAELIHRRSHLGVDKTRALHHTTTDAPKVLTSAPAVPDCLSCAMANIKKVAHSGTLSAPVAEPGTLHYDLKELVLSFENYRYVIFLIDEYSRYVFYDFIRNKSEAGAAVVRCIAAFNATVGTMVDADGRPLPRPRVRLVHGDREGKLMSHAFRGFRGSLDADTSVHHTLSPPHDHDLNPIAERVIGLISDVSAAVRIHSDAPVRFWPWIIAYTVDWHNSSISGVGSSSADAGITPHQRFTLRPPSIMDLATFGCLAVILKSPQHQHKPSLSGRGWAGTFLGRSRHSKGAYDVLVEGKVVTSSSVSVNEEYFPWSPPARKQRPLASIKYAAKQPLATSLRPSLPDASSNVSSPSTFSTNRELVALNLFSGPYARAKGLTAILQRDGWRVVQIDNDGEKGGGWEHDLLNDSFFAALLQRAKAGEFAVIMIAFPCSTFSITRFFDASSEKGGDPGPPIIRNFDNPDGLPESEVDPKHIMELRLSNKLLDRTVELAIAARHSPARATIVAENPVDRSPGASIASSQRFANHGSFFQTTAFIKMKAAAGLTGKSTFAYCRLGSPYQKYTTLCFTPEAAPVLDALNGPDFQCNHERGAHEKRAGGRGPDGQFVSSESAAYPTQLCEILSRTFTTARTGGEVVPKLIDRSVDPLLAEQQRVRPLVETPVTRDIPRRSTTQPGGADLPHPVAATPLPVSVESRGGSASSPVAFQGFPQPADPKVQRALKKLQIDPEFQGLQMPAARRGQQVPTVPESPAWPEHPSPSPIDATAAAVMRSAGTECAFDASHSLITESAGDCDLVPISGWHATPTPPSTKVGKRLPGGERSLSFEVAFAMDDEKAPSHALIAAIGDALRADSPDAPSTHAEAAARDPVVWVQGAEAKELSNHKKNESWITVTRDEVPAGRRIHKLIWVYKVKRDGTAKARLCVQGTTLEADIDYDQVFSAALRYSSARALFAYAARNRCKVRSVDLVAAYLQGRFVEGEVVFCHLPTGYPQFDAKGRPLIAKVQKPIYGIQQAGRRLQRMMFEWLRSPEMGFKQLDDSDGCIFTLDCPDGEVLTIGIYVDNLQIVHSASLDDSGRGPHGCAYNDFMDKLAKRWDVTDEGPMEDLLGIEVDYKSDGSIKLHQKRYIEKVVQRFMPNGPLPKAQRNSLPYSGDFLLHINESLSQSEVLHPELVREMQSRAGCLMYAATSTRPDIAFAVHQLCRCLHKPTPALIRETEHLLSYLARTSDFGITYSPDVSKLAGFADASWETAASTSGWVALWQSAALTWGSRKQKCIALSTCEAEIIALSEAAKDMVYLRKLVLGLGAKETSPSRLATDSKSARDVSYNPERHDNMKHVQRRHFFVRDMVESFEIEVPHVATADNLADILTKPMRDAKQFHRLRKIIMNDRD